MAVKLTYVFFNIYPFIPATDFADVMNACVIIKFELWIHTRRISNREQSDTR